MLRPNLQSVALAVPEIIAIAVWGGVENPQSWGRGDRRGSGMIPFERALVTSYRPTDHLISYFNRIFDFYNEVLKMRIPSSVGIESVAVISKQIFSGVSRKKCLGAWPLIISEATTANRNYYRTN